MFDQHISVYLRDTHATVQPHKITNWYGFDEKDKEILTSLSGATNFIKGHKIFSFLSKNFSPDNANDIVNIVIPGLRSKYYSNRKFLSEEEQKILELFSNRPVPKFINVSGEQTDFQLFGSITQYDVLHIPVADFIRTLNNKEPLLIKLDALDIIIELSYSRSDFWDSKSQQLIEYIVF